MIAGLSKLNSLDFVHSIQGFHHLHPRQSTPTQVLSTCFSLTFFEGELHTLQLELLHEAKVG